MSGYCVERPFFLEAPSRNRWINGASAHVHFVFNIGLKSSENMATTCFLGGEHPWWKMFCENFVKKQETATQDAMHCPSLQVIWQHNLSNMEVYVSLYKECLITTFNISTSFAGVANSMTCPLGFSNQNQTLDLWFSTFFLSTLGYLCGSEEKEKNKKHSAHSSGLLHTHPAKSLSFTGVETEAVVVPFYHLVFPIDWWNIITFNIIILKM